MSGEVSKSDVLKAVEELKEFLADQVPPLVVADSIDLLMHQPPGIAAFGIATCDLWT